MPSDKSDDMENPGFTPRQLEEFRGTNAIPGKEAVQAVRRRVSWLAGVQHQRQPASTPQHEGGAKPARSPADDYAVMHGESTANGAFKASAELFPYLAVIHPQFWSRI